MRNFPRLLRYAVIDLTRHKSFYVLLIISLLFVLMLRGCYKQNYMVNGQQVNSVTIAWHASIAAFHIVAAAGLVIGLFLSFGGLRRDRDDGSVTSILSRPVSRIEYALAKIAGQWLTASFFMVVLHCAIFIIAYINTHGVIPGYLIASAICSLNVLFMVVLVNALSLFLPDFASALVSLAVAMVGFFSDSFYVLMGSALVKNALPQAVAAPSLWRIAWPKIASLQYYAVSCIDNGNFHAMGPLHPAVNVALWIALVGSVFVWKFHWEEL